MRSNCNEKGKKWVTRDPVIEKKEAKKNVKQKTKQKFRLFQR